MIYLDYQATTPLAPEAFAAMEPWLKDGFANPHSAHAAGRAAAAAVEVARDQIAALLPKGGRVIFTSGATEAINLAIMGCGLPVTAAATEHAAVLDTVEFLNGRTFPVDSAGLIRPEGQTSGSEGGQALTAIMLVNNEIGTIQPIVELAGAAHAQGNLFLCDAVQAFGRMPIPDGPDMIAISAHKIHGQEQGMRSGTLSPALCAGFGAAAKLAAERMDADAAHVSALWDRAARALADWTINGSAAQRYKGNLNIRRDGVDAARLISECRSIAFSAGSACASGSGRPSHVLRALGLTDAQAKSSIRLGFGRYTTAEEIDMAADAINRSAEAML
jgi:cysteine desulfurase